MDWGLLIATVASIAAVAIVAVVQARAARTSELAAVRARDESQKARDESVCLAKEANAAFIRQAEAQEKANAPRSFRAAEPRRRLHSQHP